MRSKCISVILALLVFTGAFTGCNVATQQKTVVRVGVLNGPTGMGAAKLIYDADAGITENDYVFEQFAAPTDIIPLLINGELDIAALPTNVAATLYNSSGRKIKLLALNTLGVLYVVTNRADVKSLNDLSGKTVYISGQGSTPEYAFDYILNSSGINGVTVEFIADHQSLVSKCVLGDADIAVLPEPMVSVLIDKDAGFKAAISLNDEWDKACNGTSLFSMGCVVVRTEYALEHKEAVDCFMREYEASVSFVNNNVKLAADMIAKTGIVASATLAEKVIPGCNIVFISGKEMQTKTNKFLSILYNYNASCIGGVIPDESFYY